MPYATMEVLKHEQVGVVRMDYNAENRFNPAFISGFMAVLDEAERNPETGALVVTGGNPKFFSNGLDLDWMMANAGDLGVIRDYLLSVNAMFKRVTLYPKPIVAALNGHTYAAGVFLAAHMDFRFMREDRGWVCLPEVNINIPLLPGMIAVCRSVMTPQGFRHMYYTGHRVTAKEAMAFGLVDAVYTVEDLLPKSVEFASALAKKKTATYAEMKRRMKSGIAQALDEADPPLLLPTLRFTMGG